MGAPKDTNIYLLVSDHENKETMTLQVKFTKRLLATDRNKKNLHDHMTA